MSGAYGGVELRYAETGILGVGEVTGREPDSEFEEKKAQDLLGMAAYRLASIGWSRGPQ